MRRIVGLTFCLLLTLGTPYAQTQDEQGADAVIIPFTESLVLTSETNNRDYRISVGLPLSYESSDGTYPVLYILDPDISFGTAVDFARLMSPHELPELIVVGIGYPTDSLPEIIRLREMDYITENDQFLEFINQELIPLIDSRYRTNPSDRAIAGFSAGGEFVLHMLSSMPELFQRYIAMSSGFTPAFRRSVLSGEDDQFRQSLAGLNVKLFVSVSSLGWSNGAEASPRELEAFAEALETQAYEGLEFTTFLVENATHFPAQHLSLPKGIIAVYCGRNLVPAACGTGTG